MKRNQFSKKLISMAASMAIAMSAAAQLCITPVAAEEKGNYIQNGSFEAPNIAEVAGNPSNEITTEADAGNKISYRNEGWMVTSESTFIKVSLSQTSYS